MKKTVIVIIVNISLCVFFGCSAVTGPEDNVTPVPQGTISVGINRLSNSVYNFISPLDTGSKGSGKAYFIADRVEVRLSNGSGETLEEITLEIAEFPFNFKQANFVVDYGSGYAVEADVYNNLVSTTVPVVSGRTEGIDVSNPELYGISIFCFPLPAGEAGSDTILLTESTQSDIITDIAPVDYDILYDEQPVHCGEQWFEVTVSTAMTTFTLIPEDSTQAGFYFQVFGEDGSELGDGGLDMDNLETPALIDLTADTVPGDTYYIGVIMGSLNVGGDALTDGGPFRILCTPN
jgi:hypothetical protein